MAQGARNNETLSRALDHADIMRLIREADETGFVGRSPVPARPSDETRDFQPRGFTSGAEQELPALEVPEDRVELSPRARPALSDGAGSPLVQDAHSKAPSVDAEAIRKEAWAEGYQSGLIEGEAKGRLTAPETEGEGEAVSEDALAAARAEGHAEAYAQAQEELAEAREAFLKAAEALMRPDTDAMAGLRDQITEAVRKLASDRAGVQIDSTPARFAKRIDAIVENIAAGVSDVIVRLNPKDLEIITPHLHEAPLLQDARLIADKDLRRGDVGVSTPDISITDSLNRR